MDQFIWTWPILEVTGEDFAISILHTPSLVAVKLPVHWVPTAAARVSALQVYRTVPVGSLMMITGLNDPAPGFRRRSW